MLFESHKIRLEGFLLGFGRGGVLSGVMLSLVEMRESIFSLSVEGSPSVPHCLGIW